MLPPPEFFAAANPADLLPAPPSNATTQAFKDLWVVLGIAFALGLLFLLWARFMRSGGDTDPQRRRVHGAKRGQRPVNPTLAETGGLPPVRPDAGPPSPPPQP